MPDTMGDAHTFALAAISFNMSLTATAAFSCGVMKELCRGGRGREGGRKEGEREGGREGGGRGKERKVRERERGRGR